MKNLQKLPKFSQIQVFSDFQLMLVDPPKIFDVQFFNFLKKHQNQLSGTWQISKGTKSGTFIMIALTLWQTDSRKPLVWGLLTRILGQLSTFDPNFGVFWVKALRSFQNSGFFWSRAWCSCNFWVGFGSKWDSKFRFFGSRPWKKPKNPKSQLLLQTPGLVLEQLVIR